MWANPDKTWVNVDIICINPGNMLSESSQMQRPTYTVWFHLCHSIYIQRAGRPMGTVNSASGWGQGLAELTNEGRVVGVGECVVKIF